MSWLEDCRKQPGEITLETLQRIVNLLNNIEIERQSPEGLQSALQEDFDWFIAEAMCREEHDAPPAEFSVVGRGVKSYVSVKFDFRFQYVRDEETA